MMLKIDEMQFEKKQENHQKLQFLPNKFVSPIFTVVC